MAKAKDCPECSWMEEEIKRLDKVVKKLRKSAATESPEGGLHYRNFEVVWAEYPEKKGKHDAWLKFKAQVKTPENLANIHKALENYKADMVKVREKHPERPWLHGGTWFNHRWEDFIGYQAPGVCVEPYKPNKVEALNPEEYVKPQDLKKLFKDFNRSLKSTPRASNKFVEPIK